MSQSQELAIPETGSAFAVSDEMFKDIARGGKFLPRLTLTAPLSTVCVEGKCLPGRWAIIDGQTLEDLGQETRGFVCAMRLKAMDTGADPVVSYYNPALPEFKAIQERSKVEKQGPLAGPEFLIYIAQEKIFCSLFMCSKTMKREAPLVKQLLKKPATFKITLANNKKNKWHAPVITSCGVPLEPPDAEKLQKAVHSFMNPPANEVEAAGAEESAATDRDR